MPTLLDRQLGFPDPRTADSSGLVAVGGDLSVDRLLLAYRHGIFPWSAVPITWWSPDPRAIFEYDLFHCPRSLAKIVDRCAFRTSSEAVLRETGRKLEFEITIDRAFRKVVEGCANTREKGNWISPPFIDAYTRLYEAGYVHSLECWRDGELAGGIYGVAMGGLFAGESMFHWVSNASKVALCFLIRHLQQRGFVLFDIQTLTETTRRFGAVEITRENYLNRLAHAITIPVTF